MKKLHYFLLCLLTITLINCSRDNDEAPLNTENLKGIWMPVATSLNGTAMIDDSPLKIDTTVPLSDCERRTRLTFNNDNRGEVVVWATEINGDCEKQMDETFTYIYEKAGRSVTLNLNNKLEKSTIVSLTDKELVSEQYVDNQEVKGVPNARFTGKVRMIYKKAN